MLNSAWYMNLSKFVRINQSWGVEHSSWFFIQDISVSMNWVHQNMKVQQMPHQRYFNLCNFCYNYNNYKEAQVSLFINYPSSFYIWYLWHFDHVLAICLQHFLLNLALTGMTALSKMFSSTILIPAGLSFICSSTIGNNSFYKLFFQVSQESVNI